jgi:hypothetical protein
MMTIERRDVPVAQERGSVALGKPEGETTARSLST